MAFVTLKNPISRHAASIARTASRNWALPSSPASSAETSITGIVGIGTARGMLPAEWSHRMCLFGLQPR